MKEEFKITPVNYKPNKKKYQKISKYDRIINSFIISKNEISEININKNVNYARTQLKKRIINRKLENSINVTIINNKLYIEKIKKL